jgi:hypothetical protein
MNVRMKYRDWQNRKQINVVDRTFYGWDQRHLDANVSAYIGKHGIIDWDQISPGDVFDHTTLT